MNSVLNTAACLEELAFCVAAGLFLTAAPLVTLALMTVGLFVAPYRRNLLLAAVSYIALGTSAIALNMALTPSNLALVSIIATASILLMIASIAIPVIIIRSADRRRFARRTEVS